MSQSFIKNVEDFKCGHCGEVVVGSGYTNHCPKCLWSQHVDVSPGDRAHLCRGLMAPLRVELLGEEYVITHHCGRCGVEKGNKAAKNDDISSFLNHLL